MFYAIFWINLLITSFSIIYSILSLVRSIRISLYEQMIYFFDYDAGIFILLLAIASGIGTISYLVYTLVWNKNRFFYRKRNTWKIILAIMVLDLFSVSILGAMYLFVENDLSGGIWYYDVLSYVIAILYFLALLGTIYFLIRSYHKDKPDLIARNLSTVWLRYQFLVIPDDGVNFDQLSMDSKLEYKPKKLLGQVLICWDFKTISQAFADVEQAKSELAKLIKEVEIVFSGDTAK